ILQAFLDGVGGDGHGGGTEARWRRLAEDLGAVNLASLAAARDDFDPADRPPEAGWRPRPRRGVLGVVSPPRRRSAP
ncbi:hypothetical protein, partial [Streptomyces sp. NPDC060243]|uniref:hypothetical protein n=1 Tax=Streptomyces sp. NPDC060243 TaxID=3347081 RepID=UPI00365FD531